MPPSTALTTSSATSAQRSSGGGDSGAYARSSRTQRAWFGPEPWFNGFDASDFWTDDMSSRCTSLACDETGLRAENLARKRRCFDAGASGRQCAGGGNDL
eukprot:1847731-Pleurochrysis_carterae.AAC.7